MPQETHTVFDFTVLDIVLMGRFPHLGTFVLEGPADLAIARHALDATGMASFEVRILDFVPGPAGRVSRRAIQALGALDQLTGAMQAERKYRDVNMK